MRVEDLTPVERKLRAAFLAGEDFDLRPRSRTPAGGAPKDGAAWGPTRSVRAEVIAWLLTSPGAADTAPTALRLIGARVVGELDLDYRGITCPVRFVGCHIAGPIRLYDARTRHFAFEACRLGHFYGANMTVNGTFRMSACVVTGVVRLSNAHITALANLVGTRVVAAPDPRPGIDNAGISGVAVDADRLRVDGHLWMAEFQAVGEVVLRSAHIGGDLDLHDARLAKADSGPPSPGAAEGMPWGVSAGGVALGMARLRLEGRLNLYRAVTDGVVDLRHARIAVLWWPDPEQWPERVRLDGLAYDRVQAPQPAARQAALLLRDVDGYVPQPFEQLAAMYRAIGHEAEARTVQLAKERLRHKSMPWYARVWGLTQDAIVGYGYRPLRAGAWLGTLLILGTVVFATHRPRRTPPGDGTVFNPFVYTLDRLFPVMGLGQKSEFTATPGTQWFGYVLTAAGWLLATAVAAAASRSLNRT